MIRRVGPSGLALLAVLLLFPVKAYAVETGDLAVTFHYVRAEQDYEGFRIWSWVDDQEGKEYGFSGVDGHGARTMVSYSDISEDSRIGFLIKLNDWESGEIRADRFLDLSKIQNGALDVYILQSEAQVYYSQDELPEGGRLQNAYLDSFSQVAFEMTQTVLGFSEEPDFSIFDDNGKTYPVKLLQMKNKDLHITGTLSVEGIEDLRRTLYLQSGELSLAVQPRGVFDTPAFQERCCYDGDDLGAVWSPERTAFRLWAPTASAVEVALYRHGTGGEPILIRKMEPAEGGTWYLALEGNFDQAYYTYRITAGEETREAVDPYARACGLNGVRGMVIDLEATFSGDFHDQTVTQAGISRNPIVYEMSVRDFSMDSGADFANPGTFRAVVQSGVTNEAGGAAGIDYLEDLGITYVHLMPTQDSPEVDENDVSASYNWGYMTRHFFIPEGGYSVNPGSGTARIREFKEMVSGLHRRGIGVVMDVVYNHTAGTSMLEDIVPGYYYRREDGGGFSNGSSCGNETATERTMVRKLIVDSVSYWLKEYHVDGFRFDLMGLIDLETMQKIQDRAAAVRPDVLLYGEGWTAGDTCYKGRTGKSVNAGDMPGVGVFNNVYRRSVRKYVCGIFEEEETSGEAAQSIPQQVCYGITAAVGHPFIQSMGRWTRTPEQSVNYASCHDGYTLWDLIRLTRPEEPEDLQKRRELLSASITLLAQGTPFFQSGEEFLRSKTTEGDLSTARMNSYDAGDGVNSLKWSLTSENLDIVDYYKGLIAFRKAHPGMWMQTVEDLRDRLTFLDMEAPIIGYTVKEQTAWWKDVQVCVVHNPLNQEIAVPLPGGVWNVYVQEGQAGTDPLGVLKSGAAEIAPVSTLAAVHTSLSAAGWCAVVLLVVLLLGVCGLFWVMSAHILKKKYPKRKKKSVLLPWHRQ